MGVIHRAEEAVAILTMCWPETRNAMGPDEAGELTKALQKADAESETAVIVLGAEGRCFCAGGNLEKVLEIARDGAEVVRGQVYSVFQNLFRTIRSLNKPLIAAVDGGAIGFGADLALATDLTIVGDEGWLRQGWTPVGLIPATGGTQYVARRAGRAAVIRFLAASHLTGEDCVRLGLAESAPNALAEAIATGRSLAALPRTPMLTVNRLSKIDDLDRHLEAALDVQVGFITGADFMTRAEGILAQLKGKSR